MTKIQSVILASLTVLTFGAGFVASASAETTKVHNWLEGASKTVITESQPSETVGALLLEDAETIAGKASVVCRMILSGTVGAEGKGEITIVLNFEREIVSSAPLTEMALLGTGSKLPDCETEATCAEGTGASPIEVWPVGLPWSSLLFLMENGETLNLVEKVGYELLCLVLGINVVDECASVDGEVLVVNNASGDASTPAKSAVSPEASCTQSGEKDTGVTETVGETLIELEFGELLSIE
jgi:hypothetical protein